MNHFWPYAFRSASRIRTRNTERMKFFYHHINRSDNLFNKFFFKIKKVCKFPKPKSTETSILAENLPKIEIIRGHGWVTKNGFYKKFDFTFRIVPTKPFTYASTQPEGRRERFRFQLYEQLRRPDFQFCAPNIAKSFPPLEERSMEIDIVVEFFILSLSHHRKNVEVKFFLSITQKKKF